MNRRQFVTTAFAAAVSRLDAQNAPYAQDAPDWGGPVLDIHHHHRRNDGNVVHMQGCGVSNAVILASAMQDAAVQAEMEKYPGRFVRFAAADLARPNAIELLTASAKSGAIGFGEIKSRVALDGPEMRRLYDLAAELRVPVLIHFQEIPQSASDGKFSYNFDRLPGILKEYSKTTFIGHADFFWANISADVPPDAPYPTGPVKRGGLTDKMLADFPNLYGDLSANSGRNSLARDPAFSRDFLARHQNKLMFGSDCSCRDGKGTGQGSQQPLIKGKCVARETLTALKELTSPQVFRKIAWENGKKLLKIG